MRFKYTESLIKEVFRELVLHNSDVTSGPITDFKMEHPIMGRKIVSKLCDRYRRGRTLNCADAFI